MTKGVVTCAGCGEGFYPSRQGRAKWCSRKCKDAARQRERRAAALAEAGERHCAVCGAFMDDSIMLDAKCCSPRCRVIYSNQVRAEARVAAWKAQDLHCDRCGKPIPVPEHGKRRTKYCSEQCKYLTLNARWRERSPGYNRQYNYGLAQEQFDALLASQDGKCAICRTDTWKGKDSKPHVDHDHVTGEIRGILCGGCNNGLGNFGDDPARLRAAADYLERGDENASG